MAHGRLLAPAAILPAIADRPALDRPLADLEAARPHPERPEQGALDKGAIGLARDVGDDPPEQRIAEIAILHPQARRPVEGDSGAEKRAELGFRHRRLPVAPGIVGDEAGRVVKEIADPERPRIGRRIAPALQLGHVGVDGRVQSEQAPVAKREDAERGEGLGHGGNSEQAVAIDRPPGLQVLDPEASDMDQPPVHHDPVDEAGDMALPLVIGEDRIELLIGGGRGDGDGPLFLRLQRRRSGRQGEQCESGEAARDVHSTSSRQRLRRCFMLGTASSSATNSRASISRQRCPSQPNLIFATSAGVT